MRQRINSEPEFEVAAMAHDGKRALEIIDNKRPDAIILDIIIPECDGVQVLQQIRKNMPGYNPVIYIVSGIGTDTVINMLNNMDIDYYSLKPIKLETLIQNLKSIIFSHNHRSDGVIPQSAEWEDVECVKDFMRLLELQPHSISTRCVVEAVVFYLHNPDSNRILTKVIYPQIAEKYSLSDSSVEKNIRKAIALAQEKNTATYQSLFSFPQNEKMTNSGFLLAVSDHLSQKM